MRGEGNMKMTLEVVQRYEKFALMLRSVPGNDKGKAGLSIYVDYPIMLQDISGVIKYVRYDRWEAKKNGYYGIARIVDRYENEYEIIDFWFEEEGLWKLERSFECIHCVKETGIRITTELRCRDKDAQSFDDYQFMIPGSFYNKNDTDEDGRDDYLGTFSQDYKDDRNPMLSVTAYIPQNKYFLSLIRADTPVKDTTITRAQIGERHFIHETDIGSLGMAPSKYCAEEFILRCDYPFFERNTFCLNVDGSGWSAYKQVKEGVTFKVSYLLQYGLASSLTEASWNTTVLQMNRILNPETALPVTLCEARSYRREMILNSFLEFKDKKGTPAGYFVHFSPRQSYGSSHLLEYGFCGAQTLLALDMLVAGRDTSDLALKEKYRESAVKTINFLVEYCMDDSGLPNGIYNVEKETFVYWWTGILFPFQYSNDRKELQAYLGNQVVDSLMGIASELGKVKGNYCRSMVDTMYYLMKCYLFEKECGREHPLWQQAVLKFCDKLIVMQNENGSWNRGYTMQGEPLTNPPEWFGASELEQGSGVIFPVPLLIDAYRYTANKAYLVSAERAAAFIMENYVGDVRYIGGINDTTHKKSVKIDAASVMFAMRSMLAVYEQNKDVNLLCGARDAARILASWTYLWDIPFDEKTLLGRYSFKTTGWAGCDVIPACSYVDCSFQEVVPDLMRIAGYCRDEKLALLGKIVTRGMQHGLSTPGNMYGYAMPGVQCEGYMTSLWLADTEHSEFSGAAAKNKGDDNDTCNGFVNAMAIYNLDRLEEYYGTLDFDKIIEICINTSMK